MDGNDDEYAQSKLRQYHYFTRILFWSFVISLPSVLIVMALIAG